MSQSAKVLVKHINTTMMHTICGILGCDVQEILVLYNPREKWFYILFLNINFIKKIYEYIFNIIYQINVNLFWLKLMSKMICFKI